MEGTTKGNDTEASETQPLLSRSKLSGRKRAALRWVTVEPMLLLASCSNVFITTLRIQYVLVRVQEDYGYVINNTDTPCQNQTGNETDADLKAEIQADSARWLLLFNLIGAVPGFFSAVLIGALSDRFGRKPFFILSTIGSAIFAGVCTAVMAFHLPLEVFCAGDLVFGLMGGQLVMLTLCYSYVADVTTKERRTFRLVVITTTYALVGLFQIGVEYCYEALGFAATSGIATGLGVLALLYSVIPGILLETVERRDQQQQQPGGVGKTLRQTLQGIVQLFHGAGGTERTACLLLIFASDFAMTPMESSFQVRLLYQQGRFCWSAVTVGYNLALYSVAVLFANIVGFKLLSKCFSSEWIFYISCFDAVAYYVVYGLIQTSQLLFWVPILPAALVGLSFPVLRGSLSKLVQADEQGVAFSFFGCVETLGIYISPVIINAIYVATVASFQPFVFFVIAGVTCIPPVLYRIMRVVQKRSSDPRIAACHLNYPIDGGQLVYQAV